MRGAVVNVYRDGDLIISKKRPRVAPAEMESIKIGAEHISCANEITVEVIGS